MKEEILWITMVVIFFQRDGLTLYLCFAQTIQYFMKDLNRGKNLCKCVNVSLGLSLSLMLLYQSVSCQASPHVCFPKCTK